MIEQYLTMNKENTRVFIESNQNHLMFSGELGNTGVHNFKPILVGKTFKNVIKSWWRGVDLIPVKYSLLDYDWVDNLFTEYEWLYLKGSGTVYKVYSLSSREVIRNPFVNMFSHDGKVCIKDVGVLPYEDFLVFNF